MYEKLKRKYKNLIKKNMKQLNTYKPEYDMLIEVFAGILSEYDLLTAKLIESDFNIEVETERGGTRKSATATAHEKLRTDIAMYSDRMLLNPKMIIGAKLKEGVKESGLMSVLRTLEEGNKND